MSGADFGSVLKSLRYKAGRGVTQKMLWTHLDVSKRTYQGWEMGERVPEPKYLQAIARYLALSEADEIVLYRAAAQVPPERVHLPFPTNDFFTGRSEMLRRLETLLEATGNGGAIQPVVMSGLGGIGKTQVALAYAHQHYGNRYKAVFWVNAAEQATIEASYRDIARKLGVPTQEGTEVREIIEAVRAWLGAYTRWLLVLDNADDLALARSYLPTVHHGHILLTTRSHLVGTITSKQIELAGLEPAEALRFLLRRSGSGQSDIPLDSIAKEVREAAQHLVALMAGHPLALDQAGAHVRETGTSFAEYHELFQTHRRQLMERRGTGPSDYQDSVAAAIVMSVEQVVNHQALAVQLLHVCAFLHPDAIPWELCQAHGYFKQDILGLNEALATLQRYALISLHQRQENEAQTLSMHRLVQAVLIDRMKVSWMREFEAHLILALQAALPVMDSKVGHWKVSQWSQLDRLVPHVLISATWPDNPVFPREAAIAVYDSIAQYLVARNRYTEAERLADRVLVLYKQQFGADALQTADALHMLATIYLHDSSGREVEGTRMQRQVQAIREQHLGVAHPGVVVARSMEQASEYIQAMDGDTTKLDAAERLLQEALNICEAQWGMDHVTSALVLCQLGNLYLMRFEFMKGEETLYRALGIVERLAGITDPFVNLSLQGLAATLKIRGKHDAARQAAERILAVEKHRLGDDHPDISALTEQFRYILHGAENDATMSEGEAREKMQEIWQRWKQAKTQD